MTAKRKVRAKTFDAIQGAVNAGVAYGYRRAFKYTDTPGEAAIVQEVADSVVRELCEALTWDEP